MESRGDLGDPIDRQTCAETLSSRIGLNLIIGMLLMDRLCCTLLFKFYERMEADKWRVLASAGLKAWPLIHCCSLDASTVCADNYRANIDSHAQWVRCLFSVSCRLLWHCQEAQNSLEDLCRRSLSDALKANKIRRVGLGQECAPSGQE